MELFRIAVPGCVHGHGVCTATVFPCFPAWMEVPRMSRFATTPHPPYIAVVFTSLRTPGDNGYADIGEEIDRVLSGQDGYLGMESVRGMDGYGITVSYWATLDCVVAWRRNIAHAKAMAMGRAQWYERYALRVCQVERDSFFSMEGPVPNP